MFVNRFLQAFYQPSDHVFLTDDSSFHIYSGPLRAGPHFHHSSLIDAYVVALHREAAHEPREVVVSSQRLIIQMQRIREGNIVEITQPNGYLLQVKIRLVLGGTELRLLTLAFLEIQR